MREFYLFFILFLYYGGIETAAEISGEQQLSQLLKISAALFTAVFSAGVLYYFFSKNMPFELKFMTVPLTFMLTASGASYIFYIEPRKILFSSLAGVLILSVPGNTSGFFVGLAAGAAGFSLAALILYRICGKKEGHVFDRLPAILISAAVITMIVELFFKP